MTQAPNFDFQPSPWSGGLALPAIEMMLKALRDCNSGPVAPPNPVAGMLWRDTAAGTLKVRNPGNSAWIDLLADLGITLSAAQVNAAGQVSGRNLIINGQGRINQRAYVSGTATTAANQYTLDRWRVVTSGQSLTFSGDASRRVMTAPAGGVEQVIEASNIVGGTYVLNWFGTAQARVNGTIRAKGEAFTLPANANATIQFRSGTFSDVQVEQGALLTPFERLPIGDELARCQRFYETGSYQFGSAATDASGVSYGRIYFKTTKRNAVYSVSRTDQILINALASAVGDQHTDGFDIQASGAATGSLMRVRGIYTVDNEL